MHQTGQEQNDGGKGNQDDQDDQVADEKGRGRQAYFTHLGTGGRRSFHHKKKDPKRRCRHGHSQIKEHQNGKLDWVIAKTLNNRHVHRDRDHHH